MSTPGRSSKLDPYAEEILALHRQGRSLDFIAKHLAATYKLSTALSTLSDFVKRSGSAMPHTPLAPGRELNGREEALLGEAEVYAEIRGAIMLLGADVQAMRTALPSLGTEVGQQLARQTALLEAMNGQIKDASRTAEIVRPGAPPPLPRSAPGTAPAPYPADVPVPAETLRRIWIRAFWGVSALWCLALLLTYALGFWQVAR